MTVEVQEAGPRVLAHGRFKLTEVEDGALWVGVATDICQRCQECGCGDKRQPYHIPGMMLRMFGSKLRGMFGDGDDDEPGPAAA